VTVPVAAPWPQILRRNGSCAAILRSDDAIIEGSSMGSSAGGAPRRRASGPDFR